MNLADARKILGLDPDQDPAPVLPRLRATREQLAAMVREAANDSLAERYQKELMEFDQALAAVRENLDPPEPTPLASPVRSRSRLPALLAWLAVTTILATVAGWIHLEKKAEQEAKFQARLHFLERQSSALIENRRWDDAEDILAEIETLSPASPVVSRGREGISQGILNEQNQHISYWNGQAIAELEAGRLEEAIAAARQVTSRFPSDLEANAIIARAEATKADRIRISRITQAREQLHQRKWDEAISAAQQILSEYPGDPEANAIQSESIAARSQFLADQTKASELIEMALARDQGAFDTQALEYLREAKLLAPENPRIDPLLEKFSSYIRTLRIPGDFPTPAEAISNSRPRDRIILSSGTWKGPLVVHHALELQGEGPEQTRIECSTVEGNVITILPDAVGVLISGIGFRHDSPLAVGAERFAVALVRGGGASFADCHFLQASGHGLAAIEGGRAELIRCRFAENGWNGVAAVGKGTSIEARDCESLNNIENGIESWDGAAATVTNTRCEGNSRNGIHTDNGASAATLVGNQLIANREFGLVAGSAGLGKITGNTARTNLLGGFVIRRAAACLAFTANHATLNEGPGLTLEKGLPPADYQENTFENNTGRPILSDIELAAPLEGP